MVEVLGSELKAKDNIKKDDAKRKVIFLDIEGVIQPFSGKERFVHEDELDKLIENLSEKYDDEVFKKMDKYDVATAFFDWNTEAIDSIKMILGEEDKNVEIIISSDCRFTKSIEQLKCLLKIYNLDTYLTGIVPITEDSNKEEDIKKYLLEHRKLKHYVIIDAINMEKSFLGHFVSTEKVDFLNKNLAKKAKNILNIGPWWESYHKRSYEFEDSRHINRTNLKKAIFLDIDGVLNDDGKDCEKGILIDEGNVCRLKKIIEETGAMVVLSSSWKIAYADFAANRFVSRDANGELSQLQRLLNKYDIYIEDAIPSIKSGPDGRPLEIRAWLSKRLYVDRFIILDDDTFWNWGWLKPFFIPTYVIDDSVRFSNRIKGLNDEHVQKAIHMLNYDYRNEYDEY